MSKQTITQHAKLVDTQMAKRKDGEFNPRNRTKPHDITGTIDDIGITMPRDIHMAHVHPASVDSVRTVLNAPIDDDGRSDWVWLRLPNGDLLLGVFPRGDTYFEVERDAMDVREASARIKRASKE